MYIVVLWKIEVEEEGVIVQFRAASTIRALPHRPMHIRPETLRRRFADFDGIREGEVLELGRLMVLRI